MKKLLTNNIGYKLISVLFAILLWLVVINISDPTVTRTISGIPVTKVDEGVLTGQGKVYVVLEGNSASISVKGPRSIVDGLDADDFIAEAPFAEMTNLNAVPIYVKHKHSKYEKSVEITQKTRTMVLSVEDIITKYFDINVNYIGATASGYSVGNIKLSPTTVKLSAPESVMEQIESAYVDVDITKLKGNMESDLVIKYYDKAGNKVELGEYATASTQTVKVNVAIYQIKEVPITVSVTGKAADGYEYIELELSKEKVAIEGENVALIDSIALPNDLVDVTDAKDDVLVEVDISQYLPAGTRLVNDGEKMVTITAKVEKYVVATYDLPIENIELRNIPNGMEAEFVDSSAKLKLIGLKANHSLLDINNIKGYIDLKDAKKGTRTYVVVLNIPDIVELYSEVRVKVTVKEEEKETTTKETTSENVATTENITTIEETSVKADDEE